MNNLEYIEKQILIIKESIQYHRDVLAEKNDKEVINNFIAILKKLEDELKTLQQIKAELEAWEVVKKEITIKKIENYHYPAFNIKTSGRLIFNINGRYETLKKALEVKENDH